MKVAIVTEFAASRKEPLALLFRRIHAAFLACHAGLGGPLGQGPVHPPSVTADTSRARGAGDGLDRRYEAAVQFGD